MDLAHRKYLADYLAQSADAISRFAADRAAQDVVIAMAERVVTSLRAGGKLLIAGNGGSAADAQHMAGAFVSRFMFDRAPLAAIALTTDTSALTAIGNDQGFDHVFERQVRALGRPGDVLLAITTSGRSQNILRALSAAHELGVVAMGFSGPTGGPMSEVCDLLLRAPGGGTSIIQQIHITAGHMMGALIERTMFGPRDA